MVKFHKPREQLNLYMVYDNRTDMPLVLDGTAAECAAILGIKVGSFRRYMSRAKHRPGVKWYIEKLDKGELLEEEDF